MTADPFRTASRPDFIAALEGEPPGVFRAAMRRRCRHDLWLFCAAYLPLRFTDKFSRMHKVFLGREKTRWTERDTVQRIADAAPRENAKSTIESWASVVHDVVYGLEAYVCILSTTFDLSEDLVKDLHQVFSTDEDGHNEQYAELHEAYGPIKVKGTKTDFVVTMPGGDPRGCRLKAFSFGGAIRGTKHHGIRPTKVLMDDSEHPERVRSPGMRAKTWEFLVKDVLKCGSRCTIYRMVGTVLHPESMLEVILNSPGWQSRRWKSIEKWPTNLALWDRCKRLWADLSDPDREATARRFYQRKRVEMDAGAVVLWPEHEPLYDLMVMRWADGEAAFSFEKQNEPLDPTRQIFTPDTFPRCQFEGQTITTSSGRVVNLRACKLAVWLDPRASENIKRNDYAGCALVAREIATGQTFVLSVLLERAGTDTQLSWLWMLFERYPQAAYGYEDNGFAVLIGKLLEHERAARRTARKGDQMPLQGYCSKENKMDRIISQQPKIDLGWIEFADTLPGLLLDQYRAIPTGTHDDGPDAVERAIWLLDGPGAATADIGVSW